MFTHAHFFNIKHIAPIENLEHDGALATENHDFLVRYLVRETHIGGNPISFVD